MCKVKVVYHGKCTDGFGAAWAANKYFRTRSTDVEYMPFDHGSPVHYDHFRDCIVYIVDFSFPRATLKKVCNVANRVVVLDHHQSAQVELEGLDKEIDNLHIVFDMNRSGAGITWDYFFPNDDRPLIISYIEDRDLWRFNLENSKQINDFIITVKYTFDDFDTLAALSYNQLLEFGAGATQVHEYNVRRAIAGSFCRKTIAGYEGIPVVNSALYQSEIGHELCQENLFGVSYYIDGDGYYIWSFRSLGEFDVSEIAKTVGTISGGGHRNAAGAKTEKPIWD